jgi:adenylosuccinate synthase
MRIVALSGKIGAGKSTLCESFVSHASARLIKTHEVIQHLAKLEGDVDIGSRAALQVFGERLDLNTRGKWIADGLESILQGISDAHIVVVDSVRIQVWTYFTFI